MNEWTNEWACFVPLRAKASMKGKLYQSSCGELVHMIVLFFMIYCSLCSSLCRVFQLLRFLAALDQCTPAIFRKKSVHLLAGLPRCLLPVRGVPHCRNLCPFAALESCHMSYPFPFQDFCSFSHVCFCQLSYPSVRNSVSKWDAQDFSFHFSLAYLEVFLLQSGQIPGLISIS